MNFIVSYDYDIVDRLAESFASKRIPRIEDQLKFMRLRRENHNLNDVKSERT